jgi:hypothetical protein
VAPSDPSLDGKASSPFEGIQLDEQDRFSRQPPLASPAGMKTNVAAATKKDAIKQMEKERRVERRSALSRSQMKIKIGAKAAETPIPGKA